MMRLVAKLSESDNRLIIAVYIYIYINTLRMPSHIALAALGHELL